jgi:NADH:ubiquinone oxidoreductase subunit 6 (subunit J)
MLVLASPYINWSALSKIVLAALVGGAGVVIVFGFLLVGVKIANNAKSSGREWAGYALAGVCGLFCLAVVTAGIYAILNKPASKKPAPKKTASALIAPSSRFLS